MSTRVYVPSSIALLREALVNGGIGPAPLHAHAVTEALRKALPDSGEEEWEYAALTAAAQDSLALLGEGDAARRVVVVAEAETVMPDGDDSSVVEVLDVLPLRVVVAVHVDAEDAAEDVAAARDAWSAAEAGDADAMVLVERCMDHELGWYATQEAADLVAD